MIELLISLLPIFMLIALVIFVLKGYPVALSIPAVALLFGLPTLGFDFFNLWPIRIWNTVITNNFLIAVPLFVFMGVMLEKSGLAEDLLDVLSKLLHRVSGSLAVAVILLGAILAASTGIIGATVVTMTILALPTMLKRGYSPELATGTICASGTLGQIIPPSIVLLLLASVAQIQAVNPGRLFFAALIPGIILASSYAIYVVIKAKLDPNSAPQINATDLDTDEMDLFSLWKRAISNLVAPALLMFAVLGSIFFGVATPSEAAGIGAAGACILAFAKRRLSIGVLREVMSTTTQFTSMVFFILIGSLAFGLVFWGLGGDQLLKDFFINLNADVWVILAIIMLALFILGFFLDFLEITFIHVPILLPVIIHLGIDPLWFMVLVAINLQTSFLTPPFGFALFYLKGAAPVEIKLAHVYRGIIPFVIIQLIGLSLVILIPQLALWLPTHLR